MEKEPDGDRQPTRILVVDDDAGVRDVVRSMLESEGYAVDVACNGREALAALKATRFGIMITDLVMPEQEGIETIKIVRRDYPGLKVIAMSGAFGGDYLRIAGYLGAHSTLAKPLQMAAVLKAVADALPGAG
jgi:DNA-binding NtrC family response regulator